MKEALEKLVRELVDEKDAVEISESKERSTTIFKVKVAESDMGKLIGREGRTVKAMRSILHAVSQKSGKRFILDIVE